MIASLNLSSQTFATSTIGHLNAGVNQMGQVAGIVSRFAASLFRSQAIFVMRSSIDWSNIAKLGLYGFIVGAVVAIITRIFKAEDDPIVTATLMHAGNEFLRTQ